MHRIALAKTIILLLFLLLINHRSNAQITYDYYKNPDKIGSPNPRATEYFIRSFEFIMHWGTEDTDSAIFYMQKAIKEDSLYAIAYASLGHLIKYGGYNGTSIDRDSIARLAVKALQINPRVGDAHTLMSWVHFMNNDYQKAIESCKKAVAAEPNHRETWFWLGVRYASLAEKLDSAINAFNQSLEVDSLFGQPHQKLGWIYLYDKNDFQKAAHHFRQMIHLYEDIIPADERMILGYYGLGETLLADKKPDAAIDTFQLLLRKCDSSTLHWVDNLSSWAHSGLARSFLEKAKNEQDKFITVNLGRLAKYPDDTGIMLNAIEEAEGLAFQIKDFNLTDTLREIRLSLYERLLNQTTDEYEINSAIRSKTALLQDEKKYEKAIAELNLLMVKYAGRKEILSNIHYIMACNYALLGKTGVALKHLRLATEAGFNDFNRMMNDPDLASLKDSPKFKRIK
ncbi:MAG: hypothetical protein JW830_07955 [Bacteroidales bacterium]|nr:hypothetical protein [Bacteroidales bacterium]